jgi:hypothetical protein
MRRALVKQFTVFITIAKGEYHEAITCGHTEMMAKEISGAKLVILF